VTAMAHSTELQWAGGSDVGRVRTNNEDSFLTRPGLWVVADGMGGHRGGEIASALACEAMERGYTDHTVEGLLDAIDTANAAVHAAGENDSDLTGMGTTVVALALVDDSGEEVLAVANVGDSRAYRLSGGELEQLTEDHSLVADMVREGSLSPEEAASHPQRNILTRVVGVYDEIPVDVITVVPHDGERYLLCSDGLFNEVTPEGIAAVMRRLADPHDVVDELIRLAVEGGGRDNVTVVVIDVLSDGGQSAAASAALGTTATRPLTAEHDLAPYSGGAYADADAAGNGDVSEGRRGRFRDKAPRHSSATRPRRLTWRVALFSLIVIGLIGGVFASIQWYAKSTYYVGFAGDRVTIYQGRPGGVAWIKPTQVEKTTLTRAQVPDDVLDDLEAGEEQATLDEAQAYVTRLEDRVERNDTTTTTSTTSTTSTTTTTTTPPAPPA
jgi:PPM family protein phosphatase